MTVVRVQHDSPRLALRDSRFFLVDPSSLIISGDWSDEGAVIDCNHYRRCHCKREFLVSGVDREKSGSYMKSSVALRPHHTFSPLKRSLGGEGDQRCLFPACVATLPPDIFMRAFLI